MNNFMNMYSMLQQLRTNPVPFLLQRRYNVPQGMNDPNAILQHLVNTGQISQGQINAAYQRAQGVFGSSRGGLT